VTIKDFRSCGFESLISRYPLIQLLREAGFDLEEWELSRTPNGFWTDESNRIRATRWLVDHLGKDPGALTCRDFVKNGLAGLIRYNDHSVARTLSDADLDTGPFRKPHGYWALKENRVLHVRALVDSLDDRTGAIHHIGRKDMVEAGLSGVLRYTGGSARKALEEAGIRPEDEPAGPDWSEKSRRIEAVRDLVRSLGGDPLKIASRDFAKNGLGDLLRHHGPAHRLMREAGYHVYPWQYPRAYPGLYNSRKMRAAALRWLLRQLDKDISQLRSRDLTANGMEGIIRFYSPRSLRRGGPGRSNGPSAEAGSTPADHNDPTDLNTYVDDLLEFSDPVSRALVDCGMVPPERVGELKDPMRNRDRSWNDSTKRRQAIRNMASRSGRSPENITLKDFKNSGLVYMLKRYYRGKKDALEDAGYRISPERFSHRPAGFWKDPKNRSRALSELVERLGIPPHKITRQVLRESRMEGMCRYHPNIHSLLSEAGYVFNPWQMKRVPGGLWKERSSRADALRWLLERCGDDPAALSKKDFSENGLMSLYRALGKLRWTDKDFAHHFNTHGTYIRAALAESGLIPTEDNDDKEA